MKKRFLLLCLAALALSAEAGPISFFNTQFDVTAVAVTDGPAGFDTQSSPPGTTPVSASASSLGAVDVATAGAFGGPGLLSTSADVSAAGLASAVATSHFSGSFMNGGQVLLDLDFLPFDFADGSGSSATSLFVLLISDGVTLFQDYITGPWSFGYVAAAGTTSVLDLTLTSEVSAGFPTSGVGNASSFGQVTFAGTVPEASSWLLLSLGLGVMGAVHRVTVRRRACAVG